MRNTEWLANSGWGVFCHYLTSPQTTADEWNRQVDSFDVKAFTRQLEAVKAAYIFITIGQGSGHYCAPNETYDRITGIIPSKCSHRDLISDLYETLHPLGINLLVYSMVDGSWADHQARKGLKMTAHWNDDPKFNNYQPGPHWAQYRLPEFQCLWEKICQDWSLRFGKKIRGWWIDGAYGQEYRYPENEPPNFKTFAEVLRTGNPDAIIAFNPGVFTPIIHYTEQEDYTAGEISNALPECPGPWVEKNGHKARYHVLSYLGEWWGKGKPRFPVELVMGYTKHVTGKGGVVTWDVPIEPIGRIPEIYVEQLTAIGKCMQKT